MNPQKRRAILERLRAEKPQLKVIFSSGYTPESFERRSELKGVQAELQSEREYPRSFGVTLTGAW